MREDLLDDEDYQSILQTRYGTDVKFVKAEITSLSENVEGFLGEHYKLKITYIQDGIKNAGNFFMKTRPTGTQLQQDMCDWFDTYAKEIFLYEYLLKEFKEKGINISFAPKCYLCKDDKTIILEDMSERNFGVSGRGQFYDLSKCETLMKSLARYHSSCLIFEEEKSKDLGRTYRLNEQFADVLKECMFCTEPNSFMASFFESTDETIGHIIDGLPESEEFKTEFKKQLKEINVVEQFHVPHDCRKTIGHGDLWSNNMMFRTKNGLTQDCCILDYQVLRYHYPPYDVALALYENTGVSFRQKYWDYLINYYYGCLSEEIKSHGHSVEDILPLNVFNSVLESIEFVAMHQALGAHTFTYLPQTYFNDSLAGGDESFSDALLGSRSKVIMHFFGKVDEFKCVLTEDVYELHRCLQKLFSKHKNKK